ncbi:TonB-dependent receptor plug domain-containing protein [Oleiharenicola lentus]|uniref:TonB-dependent receptor plug domain-containing protein n=1 Tax=Oleiharenicola lentus TaxID=2508720 RepID=UPI003F664648
MNHKPQATLARRLTLAFACGVILAPTAWSQTAPAAPAQSATSEREVPVTTDSAAAKKEKDDLLQLSPFVVSTKKDSGYFAENTLAGSRLNSNLSDLAASITVVTKQQLDDTAALDINDVFKYEASTEGSSSYTPQILDRGTVKDSVGGYSFGNNGDSTTNAQSNRVRGLAAPDASLNYHPTNNRIPFDSYNTQSIEISRGPNSLLFGMGSPAGIVNQSAAQAALNRNTNSVSVRTDHVGSFRTSLAINRSLIEDKLALYAAFLYNDQQFERKPSYDRTRRQYAAMTYKPFKNTIIRAFAENYRNDANRPNFITPRDGVTPWIQAGRPMYDPVSRNITFQNAATVTLPNGTTRSVTAGQVYGPIIFDSRSPGYNPAVTTLVNTALITNPASPYYIPIGFQFDNANAGTRQRLNNGQYVDYFSRGIGFYAPAQTNPATATPSATSLGYLAGDPRFALLDRNWSMSGFGVAPPVTVNGQVGSYSSYQAAGVSDQSIYDWTRYNLNQVNFANLRAGVYNLEVEQVLLPNLFFSAGWLRQDIDASENFILSQLQGNTLLVDTNTRNIDGTTNPYAGLAYVPLGLGGGVDTFYSPETNDSYRAMLAYDLDFSKNQGWTRWFGRHRLLGLVSEVDQKRNRERWRLVYTGGDAEGRLRYGPNLSLGGQAYWSLSGTSALRKMYYAASPGDASGTVTQSIGYYGNPGSQSPYNASVQVYGLQDNTNAFRNISLTEQIAFADAGSANFQREIKSWNLATQSYLWDDRLVATVGFRHDAYRARNTTAGAITNPATGAVISPTLTASQINPNNLGFVDYDLVMNRWIPWDELEGDTKTVGAAFRPLKGWGFVERRNSEGSIVGEFLSGLTFYYNQSDNFNPPSGAQTDLFKKRLPKPTGEGRDGGFGFNLFKNKLVARVNWFETENHDERTSAAGTLLTRVQYGDTTLGIPWASSVLRIRNAVARGETVASYTAQTNWNDGAVYSVDDAASQQKIYDLLQLPLNYFSGLQLGATQQSIAKGTEVQITYNPMPNWTMKLTGTRTKSVYTDVAPQFDEWEAYRMPVWTALAATDIPDFVDGNNRAYSLRNFWNAYGYATVARIENLDGNTSTRAYYANAVTSQVALAKALQGAIAPNQRIYHASFLTNYVFNKGKLKGWSTGGSQRWESKAAVGYYGKPADPLTPLLINSSDVTRPVYLDNGNFYTDIWFAYSRKVFSDKIRMKIQLNVNNVMEDGRLDPIAVNWDGTPWAYRIIDPRQFVLTTSFDF